MLVEQLASQPCAVALDLDTVVVDARRAWAFALQQAVAAVTGERIDAERLAPEYHRRPWRHAVAVIVRDPMQAVAVERLCETFFRSSALKHLRVYEGLPRQLDRFRERRVEVAAISRLSHDLARRQIETLGLDRFFAVLATAPIERFPEPALESCERFLGVARERLLAVFADPADTARAARAGFPSLTAGWPGGEGAELTVPEELERAVRLRFG